MRYRVAMSADGAEAAQERVKIGQNLRRIRKGLGWSQDRLAEEMRQAGAESWTQSTVSRVENGGQEIRFVEAMVLNSLVGRGVWEGTSWMGKSQEFAGRSTQMAVDRAISEAIARAEASVKDALYALQVAQNLRFPDRARDEEEALGPDRGIGRVGRLAGSAVRPDGVDYVADQTWHRLKVSREFSDDE